MSWRSQQGVTGSNNVPLGTRRRFGRDQDSEEDGASSASYAHTDASSLKRGRSPPRSSVDDSINAAVDGARARKKRNRWGDANENKAAGLMGLTTAIMANMTAEQLEAYTLHLRIEEISQKLRINDVVPADGNRSPSPPPQYDNMGRRINTREYRYRKRLEEERHKLIERAIKEIPNYHPPSDYRRPTKTQEKVYVPVNDYPEINFIGLLIGPRGNTLKKMETESGAKIAIRGKGSVKEGKGRSDAAHQSNQEEDLHCLIMADTEDKVNKAKRLIHQVIETAASIPEGQNELKRNQLRELAALNGTLRDDENQACQNCGEIGHRKYDCPNQKNFTANIICRVCGNAGHMARDCPDRQRGANWRNDDRGGPAARPAAGRIGGAEGGADDEYDALMQELGGGGGLGDGRAQQRLEAGAGGFNGGDGYNGAAPAAPKPWERNAGGPSGATAGAPSGGPAPWRTRTDDRDGGAPAAAAPRPWARGNNDSYGGGYNGGAGHSQGGSAAPPWAQASSGGGQQTYGSTYGSNYGGYSGGNYGSNYGGYSNAGGYGGYGQTAGMSAPGVPPPPPGTGSWYQNAYGGSAGSPPPPPPPPGERPPPPPASSPSPSPSPSTPSSPSSGSKAED